MISRRTFLGAAGLTGGAVLLGGCGSADEISIEAATTEENIDILRRLLQPEVRAAAFYERAAELLDGEVAEAAELFARQEREHVDAITEAIEDLGGTPSTEDEKNEIPDGDDEILQAAAEIENRAIAAMNDAAGRLSDPALRRTIFEIVAVEAEHLAVLNGELGQIQVPDAFTTGARA